MSVSELSLDSNTTWKAVSERTNQDGLNVREVVLEGLDLDTKQSIIEYLKANQLNVTGLDDETYTVDLTKWDHTRSKQFVELLQGMGGTFPDPMDGGKTGFSPAMSELPDSTPSETLPSTKASFYGENDYSTTILQELKSEKTLLERRFPTHMPTQEVDLNCLNTKPFPFHPSPIYQRDELLHVKPMLISEETRSTMGSAETIEKKVKDAPKNKFLFLTKCITSPFKLLKRLRIRRFFRKHNWLRKSKEEKMKKEKAFAVYSSLLQDGPRLGREFRESIRKAETDHLRTIGTNTLSCPNLDCDSSVLSSGSRVNVGVNAVPNVMEASSNTQRLIQYYQSCLKQEIPKVFSEPEETPHWCPCQAITSSSLYKCIAKCLKSICDWESASTDMMNEDIKHHKAEIEEVRRMLHGALNLLGATYPGSSEDIETES